MLHTTATGNLGQDATVRTLPDGSTVIGFSIANNEKWTDKSTGETKERTTWISCNWFTNNTKVVPYLTKGTIVGITGKPSVETYQDKNNQTQSILKLRVDSLELIGKKDPLSGLSTEGKAHIQKMIDEIMDMEKAKTNGKPAPATAQHQTADAPNYAGLVDGLAFMDEPVY